MVSSSSGTAPQALERTDRRYLWLRKRLTARADIWRVFPEAWHLQQQICLSFCAITKQQLGEILESKASHRYKGVALEARSSMSARHFRSEVL